MTDQTDPLSQLVTIRAQSGAPDVRRFDYAALNAQTENILSTLKTGENGKAFFHLDVKGGVSLALAGYIPKKGLLRFLPDKGTWTVYSSIPWKGDLIAHGLDVQKLQAGAVAAWAF